MNQPSFSWLELGEEVQNPERFAWRTTSIARAPRMAAPACNPFEMQAERLLLWGHRDRKAGPYDTIDIQEHQYPGIAGYDAAQIARCITIAHIRRFLDGAGLEPVHVGDCIDADSDRALALARGGRHYDQDGGSVGRSPIKPETCAQVNDRDDVSAQVHDPEDVGRRLGDRCHARPPLDFSDAQDIYPVLFVRAVEREELASR